MKKMFRSRRQRASLMAEIAEIRAKFHSGRKTPHEKMRRVLATVRRLKFSVFVSRKMLFKTFILLGF